MHDDARLELGDDARVRESPSPFEVPPDSSTRSALASARASARAARPRRRGTAPRHRLAAELAYGVGEDAAVAVVDEAGPHRARPAATISSPVERIATRGRRTTATASRADRREHAGLARVSAAAKSTVSPRPTSVPAKVTLRARARPARRTTTRAALDVGVLDHHHGVGAARQHAAGGDRRRRAGPDFALAARRRWRSSRRRAAGAAALPRWRRRCPRRAPRSRPCWSGRSRARRSRRARPRPARGRAPAASGTRSAPQRREVERGAEAALRLVAVDHLEELVLLHDAVADAALSAGGSSS